MENLSGLLAFLILTNKKAPVPQGIQGADARDF